MHALRDVYARHRFAWLLALLIVAIGVDPVLEAMGLRMRLFEVMLAAALLLATVHVWRTARLLRPFALGISAVLAVWLVLHVVRFGPGPALAPALLGAAGLALAAFLLTAALSDGPVDGERIAAALCVYLLTGVAFGGLFGALESLSPGSLTGPAPLDLDEAVYFSFVTLATLGYGDISPVAPAARSLAILEAVFGQLYLAVLIARLVSLYARERPPQR